MSKVVIIGAGGVGRVVAYKCAEAQITEEGVFGEIILASRTLSKCEEIARDVKQDLQVTIHTDQVDADDVQQVVDLFHKYKPQLVINVALPYQDLTIMDACLEAGVHYFRYRQLRTD